ncbi:MAG: phosphate propanoyltransferase [Clostridiales bacterium]|nr:phosphate propanoyltransferase [Clostridiales bacterium]
MNNSAVHQKKEISVGISNRHIHLSSKAKDILFGPDYTLTYVKSLSQTGQFATRETVTIVGTKGSIEDVRILGPERKQTQVEVSRTDMYKLGVNAPVRDSGDLDGSPGIVLIGPKGMVNLNRGVICAKRHIHMNPSDATFFNVADRQEVMVKVDNERGLLFSNVLIRIDESFVLEFHIDTDEANAARLQNHDSVEIVSFSFC